MPEVSLSFLAEPYGCTPKAMVDSPAIPQSRSGARRRSCSLDLRSPISCLYVRLQACPDPTGS